MPNYKSNGGDWKEVPNPHVKVVEKVEKKVAVLEVKVEGPKPEKKEVKKSVSKKKK